MKKTNYLFLAIMSLGLFFTSCSSDDSIEGTYKITRIAQDCGGTEDDFDLMDGANDVVGIVINMNGTLTFTEAGNFVLNIDIETPILNQTESSTLDGTYTYENDVLTICDVDEECDTFNLDSGTDSIILNLLDEDNCMITIEGERI